MSDGSTTAPPDWYPDPEQPNTLRYWDGQQWTEQRAPNQDKSGRGGPHGEVIFGLVAAALMVIGALGPWVDTVFGSVGGLNGDGWIVLVTALVAGITLGFSAVRQVKSLGPVIVVVILCGLVAGGTSVYDLTQILGSETELFGEEVRIGNPGWGLWLSALASVALLVDGVALFSLDRRKRSQPATS